MAKKILVDGTYDTCPTHGPQVYMPKRQVIVTDGVVSFVDKEHCKYDFNIPSFFDVNNVFNKETGESSVVMRDRDTGEYYYQVTEKKVYIEFTAARDAFVLLSDKHPNDPVSQSFNSVKEAVSFAKENSMTIIDYGHFNLNED